MIFEKTPLNDAFLIKLDSHGDERGIFIRNFDFSEFKRKIITTFNIVQSSSSHNLYKNTLRGMHYQTGIYKEAKLVHCINGKIYDVIVDLRKNSSTYEKWYGVILKWNESLYIPEGFSHGFLTLEDNTIVTYNMNNIFSPDNSNRFKWNSPKYGIKWINIENENNENNEKNFIISEKDKNAICLHKKDTLYI